MIEQASRTPERPLKMFHRNTGVAVMLFLDYPELFPEEIRQAVADSIFTEGGTFGNEKAGDFAPEYVAKNYQFAFTDHASFQLEPGKKNSRSQGLAMAYVGGVRDRARSLAAGIRVLAKTLGLDLKVTHGNATPGNFHVLLRDYYRELIDVGELYEAPKDLNPVQKFRWLCGRIARAKESPVYFDNLSGGSAGKEFINAGEEAYGDLDSRILDEKNEVLLSEGAEQLSIEQLTANPTVKRFIELFITSNPESAADMAYIYALPGGQLNFSRHQELQKHFARLDLLLFSIIEERQNNKIISPILLQFGKISSVLQKNQSFNDLPDHQKIAALKDALRQYAHQIANSLRMDNDNRNLELGTIKAQTGDGANFIDIPAEALSQLTRLLRQPFTPDLERNLHFRGFGAAQALLTIYCAYRRGQKYNGREDSKKQFKKLADDIEKVMFIMNELADTDIETAEEKLARILPM